MRSGCSFAFFSKYTLRTRLAFPAIFPFLHTLQRTQGYSGPWEVLVYVYVGIAFKFYSAVS